MSLMRNLSAGDYSAAERVRKIASNIWRKVSRRTACCGNYGEPGC
jgi:hypothetical protein